MSGSLPLMEVVCGKTHREYIEYCVVREEATYASKISRSYGCNGVGGNDEGLKTFVYIM